MGTTSNLAGHMRIFIPTRGLIYSRRSFKRHDTIPSEWNFKQRLVVKKDNIWSEHSGELEKANVPGPNVLVQ